MILLNYKIECLKYFFHSIANEMYLLENSSLEKYHTQEEVHIPWKRWKFSTATAFSWFLINIFPAVHDWWPRSLVWILMNNKYSQRLSQQLRWTVFIYCSSLAPGRLTFVPGSQAMTSIALGQPFFFFMR